MNHLIAEIRQRGRGLKTFKVFSDEEVYTLPTDLVNPKTYGSDYKLEDDEWFHIPEFSTTAYCLQLLKIDFVSTDYDQIDSEKLKKLKFLCSYQKHNEIEHYYFQRILPSHIVSKKWFQLSNAPTLEKDSAVVVINSFPDAVYIKSEDILYFKTLTSVSPIFNGISELYKEATQEETQTFLNYDFISVGEEYNADKVGKANRKRIALAKETLDSFQPEEQTQIFGYIKDYCVNLPFSEETSSFTVSSEEELKNLLWGIEQRYYTTIVGEEKRVANSVSTVIA